jgi:hypothetical protein
MEVSIMTPHTPPELVRENLSAALGELPGQEAQV